MWSYESKDLRRRVKQDEVLEGVVGVNLSRLQLPGRTYLLPVCIRCWYILQKGWLKKYLDRGLLDTYADGEEFGDSIGLAGESQLCFVA